MNEILEIQNVSKWVGTGSFRTDILKGVSVTVRAGEFVAIMGASGSGKSTLLNIIGLLDSPSSGSMRLLGQEAGNLSEDMQALVRNRRLGFIFQNFNLLNYLTATENVALPMSYAQRDDAKKRSRMLLEQVGLNHRLNSYPTTMSGGERQRIAIARSLANEPALLLADEPTGALDSNTGSQIIRLLEELNRSGATIVMVTHDDKVAQHAQRVLVMRDGRFQ